MYITTQLMSAISSTLQSLQLLQELVAQCRPRDVFSFAVRFWKDESNSNSTVAHAFHILPYTLCQQEPFRSAACTIFTHELSKTAGVTDTLDGKMVFP